MSRPSLAPGAFSSGLNRRGKIIIYRDPIDAPRRSGIFKDVHAAIQQVLMIADKPLVDVICKLREYLMLYMYAPFAFDRAPILARLREIVELVGDVVSGERFALLPERREVFVYWVRRLAVGIVRVIDAVWAREEMREQHEVALRVARNKKARPSFEEDLSPWRQFVAAGAPALPAMRTLTPTALPKVAGLPAEFTRLHATSVQTLPSAASAILTRWAEDFGGMMRFLRERHPSDPDFRGSLASKLLTRDPFITDDDGLIVEHVTVRQVAPNNSPYARASRKGLELGHSDKTTVARFLARIERRGRALPPFAATRCYIVRQWKVVAESKVKTSPRR